MTAKIIPMHDNPLLSAALSYAALGWDILPCWWAQKNEAGAMRCACSNTACKSPAKHPISKLVAHGQNSATKDAGLIKSWWEQYPQANIAVFLEPSGLCAIDIDPRNGGIQTMDDIEAKHGLLTSDLLQFTGGGGEHRVFLAPKNSTLPGQLGSGVDVKLNGYIMLEPSNHVSGGSYAWEASSDPRDGLMASPLPDWLRDLAGARKSGPVDAGPADAMALIVPQSVRDDLEQALEHIECESRESWLACGMALHATDDRQWAFSTWDNWSQRSRKYDPVDQARVWNSFKSNRTAGQGNITYHSIFAAARQQMEKKVSPIRSEEAQTPMVESLAALATPARLERTDKPGLAFASMPVDSLNALTHWITRSYAETHPLASQATALAICCAAAGRRYVSVYGDPASVFIGIAAPSVTMARHAHYAADEAFFDAGMRSMLRSTRITSPQQLFSTLYRSPACLYLADDYGSQLRFAKRQPSGLLEQSLSMLTGRVASGQTLVLDNWQELGMRPPEGADAQPVIYAPSVTMLALIGTTHFANLFKTGEFASGAADCVLLVPTIEVSQWTQKPAASAFAIPPEVSRQIRRLRGFEDVGTTQATAEQIFGGTASILPTPCVVQFTGDIQGIEAAWIVGYAKQGNHVRQLASGARRNLRRLCTAMAAWADPIHPVATPEIVNWCASFVRQCLDATIVEANLRGGDDGDKPDIYQRVLEYIDEFGATGVAKRSITHGCKAYRALSTDKRDILIEQMLDDEAICMLPTPSGRGKVLVRSTYVNKVVTEPVSSGDPAGHRFNSGVFTGENGEVVTR